MTRRVVALLAALLLTHAPLFASPNGPKPKPPKPQASAVKPVKPVAAPKVKPVSAKHTVSKPKPIKPVKSTAVKPAKSTTVKPAKSTTTTTTATSPTTTSPTNIPVTLTKVQQKLQRNTNLANKLRGRLPAGTDLMKAAYGFKNLGQFVAAVNTSYNHDIPFWQLKRKMVREGMSLGQAKQALSSTSGTDGAQR